MYINKGVRWFLPMWFTHAPFSIRNSVVLLKFAETAMCRGEFSPLLELTRAPLLTRNSTTGKITDSSTKKWYFCGYCIDDEKKRPTGCSGHRITKLYTCQILIHRPYEMLIYAHNYPPPRSRALSRWGHLNNFLASSITLERFTNFKVFRHNICFSTHMMIPLSLQKCWTVVTFGHLSKLPWTKTIIAFVLFNR